jgi:hypothetical protein
MLDSNVFQQEDIDRPHAAPSKLKKPVTGITSFSETRRFNSILKRTECF